MKDYKLLYEATKLDLRDQVAHSADLQGKVDSLREELDQLKVSDAINLRERIAQYVFNTAYGWRAEYAQAIYDWVAGPSAPKPAVVKGKRGPYKKAKAVEISVKPWSKRKYTKKSKFWAKKKK